MLRAVLLGLVTISVVGCNKKPDAPAAQAGAPAGTVVDVTGSVSVAGKPLAKGATVAADDVVDTGADGHVQIVLAHNNATWDLGPNKHEKVSGSLAWTLAKVDTPAKAVDQDTSSAGRPAERSAADTAASADRKDEESAPRRAVGEPTPPAAPAPAPPAVQPAPAAAAETERNLPPPPPPPPAKTAGHASAKGGAVAGGDASGLLDTASGGGGGAPGGGGLRARSKIELPVEAYQKCVPGGMTLKLTVRGTTKGATYTVTNGVKLSPEVKACLDKVTAGVKLEAGAHSDLEVAK